CTTGNGQVTSVTTAGRIAGTQRQGRRRAGAIGSLKKWRLQSDTSDTSARNVKVRARLLGGLVANVVTASGTSGDITALNSARDKVSAIPAEEVTSGRSTANLVAGRNIHHATNGDIEVRRSNAERVTGPNGPGRGRRASQVQGSSRGQRQGAGG